MLEVQHLSKRYGEVVAVGDVSFRASQGDVVGVLGPNGAGKTTTIRMLATFLAPTSGTAQVAGFDICREPYEVRRRLGYLPESVPLYAEMTVREFLEFMGRIRGLAGARLRDRVAFALESCSLTGVTGKLCGYLSKGFKQRVGLAQAIVHDPEVLILDEPTSGLDPRQIVEIRKLISELGKERTVLFSSHVLQEVRSVCNRVVVIHDGRVTLSGDLESLLGERSLESVFLESIGMEGYVAEDSRAAAHRERR